MFGWLDKFGPYHKKFYIVMIFGVLFSVVIFPVGVCFLIYAIYLHINKDNERSKLGDYDWERWNISSPKQREIWIRNVLEDGTTEPWMRYWLNQKK